MFKIEIAIKDEADYLPVRNNIPTLLAAIEDSEKICKNGWWKEFPVADDNKYWLHPPHMIEKIKISEMK